MDTPRIKGSGTGPIDHGPDLPARPEKPGSPEQLPGRTGDSAAISTDGRETLVTVEAMVARLEEHSDRREHVDAVRRMLENGDLDQPEVFQETARKMLMGDS